MREVLRMRAIMVCVVVLCAVLGSISRVNGAAVMSVDLGSEWMKIGVVSPGVPMEIALNRESQRKTSAVVAFRNGVRSFGEDATTVGVRFPSNAYFYLLDLLGKRIDNPIVDLYRKRFPYYDIIADENSHTVVFKSSEGTFNVEELIAQLLAKAREFGEISTGQTISECTLIVPGFFGQAERKALLAAARLANLKVLQLVNDYTAVALNYGVFARTDINETAQYYIFYDMGAQKTSAAVVSYQLVKDKATRETNPVISVLGVGYDRNLGGLEMQLRLRDFLADEFNKLGKTKTDVKTNARSMAKLFKEAARLKKVLSANADHYAQIEGLIEEIDFRLQVTREQFENLCVDIWPRVTKPLEMALKSSGLTQDVIRQVILFGGGTRVPKVQEVLNEAIGQPLGKNLNMDEAAAIGAVYKAADLATGFRVKKFIIKDAVVFPIQVTFERENSDGNSVRQIKRTLFGHMNPYPQKKVITFNKHADNFDLYVSYADLENVLSHDEIANVGNLNLSHIELTNVAKVLGKVNQDDIDSKGIKAHFILDDSGVFDLTGIDYVYEKQKSTEEPSPDNETTLSKLGSTISKLFSGDSGNTDKKGTAENTTTESSGSDGDVKKGNFSQSATNGTDSAGGDKSGKADTLKVVVIKDPIEYKQTKMFATPLSGNDYDRAAQKLDQLNTADTERRQREAALDELESYKIEAQHRMSRDDYISCASEKEVEAVLTECDGISEWLDEDGEHASIEDYQKKLNNLKKLTNEVYARHWEHEERPDALRALAGMIDGATKFLESAKNLTKDANPEKDVFTNVEIEVLERTISETIEWKKTESEAQSKLKRNDVVRLTVKDITEKMSLLDREVKYLVNKIKLWKPKKPVVKEQRKSNETKTVDDTKEQGNTKTEAPVDFDTIDAGDDSSHATETQSDTKPQTDDEAEARIEKTPLDDTPAPEATTKKPHEKHDESQTPHEDL